MPEHPANQGLPSAAPTGAKWLMLVAVLVVADITSGVEAMMIYAAMKTLITIYGDAGSVGWLITGYLLVAAASAAICGRLGDIYGRKRMILVVLGVAVIGSLISAMSQWLPIMVLGRAMQGMAGALMPLSFGLAREVLPAKKLPLAIGLLYAAGAIGATAGLVLGGVLVDAGIWHSVFIVSAGVAGFAFLIVAIALPRGRKAARQDKIDKLGGILFVPAVAALLLAMSNIRHWGLVDMRTLGLLASGTALLLIWVRHEWRHPDPLIDVRLFMQPQVKTAMGCMAFFAFGAAQVTQLQMLFLQQPVWTGIGLGLSATFAGLLKLPANVVGTVMAPVSGYFAGTRGNRFVVMAGFAFNAGAWFLLTQFNTDLVVVVALIAFGCMTGNALLGVGIYNAVISAAPLDRTSEASGVVSVVRALFHAIGAQVMMVILASSTMADPAGGTHPAPVTFLTVFGMISAVSLVGIAMASRLRIPPRAPSDNSDETIVSGMPAPA